jgi:hypothetical protein
MAASTLLRPKHRLDEDHANASFHRPAFGGR